MRYWNGHPSAYRTRPPKSYFPSSFENRQKNGSFPDVDPALFQQSAQQMQQLVSDADKLCTALQSGTLAKDVMSAAQKSDDNTVKQLLHTTGISSQFSVSFNPDGLTVYLTGRYQSEECCKLRLVYRWR